MSQRSAPRIADPSRSFAPLAWYGAIQVLLLLVGSLRPLSVGSFFYSVGLLAGLVILTVRVLRVKPAPRTAWWLFTLAGWVLVVGGVADVLIYGVQENLSLRDPVAIVFATLPFHLVGAALGFLVQVQTRRGPAQVLDPLIAACALFLVLWMVWLGKAFAVSLVSILIVTLLPLGLLLAAATGVRLILLGGLSDPPAALAVAGSAALFASMTSLLITGVQRSSLDVTRAASLLWALFGALLGAAALHPGFSRTRRYAAKEIDETSVTRTVVFALVALVPIVVWASEAAGLKGTERRAVAVIASALLLVLLVARMGLISRIAHQRAEELDRRTQALGVALSREEGLARELEFRATHDLLTGLSNRAVLLDRMEDALSEPAGKRSHGLLLMDIDNFKEVNDTYGHPVGDQLLIALAERLRRTAPERAVIARLGGDEFAMFLEDADDQHMVNVAQALLDQLRPPFRVNDHELHVTVSVGVVTTDRVEPATPGAALRCVDQALYKAKQHGKGRLEIMR